MDTIKLPASLILVWDLRRSIENRQSLHIGIKNFNQRGLKSPFARKFEKWWQQYRNSSSGTIHVKFSSLHQRILIDLIRKGVEGIPIYENLVDLDQQMINSCDEDIEKHISLLPLLLQIPLLGLLFPAILLLLLVPALRFLHF